MKKFNSFLKIFLFTLMFIGGMSYAADTPPDNTIVNGTSDISILLLSTLFGGMPIFDSGTDALQNVFRIFNICVLSIGGVLAAYTLTLGLIDTSNKGKVFGDYSSTYTPLRTAMGVALVLPVANGYALIQVLVVWAVMQGIYGANMIWTTFVSDESLATSLAVAPVDINAKNLAKDVLIASLCMETVNSIYAESGKDAKMGWSFGQGDNRTKFFGKNELVDLVKNNNSNTINLVAGSYEGVNGMAANSCGEITINKLDKDTTFLSGINMNSKVNETINAGAGMASGNDGGKLIALYSGFRILVDSVMEHKNFNKWLDEMVMEQAQATENLLASSGSLAEAIVQSANYKEYQSNPNNTFNDGSITGNTGQDNNIYSNDVQNSSGIEDESKNNNSQQPPKEAINKKMTDEQIVTAINKLASDYQYLLRTKAVMTYTEAGKLDKDSQMYSNLVYNANNYGWALAGTFFVQMGGMADSVNQILLNTPVSTSQMASPDTLLIKNYNSKYMSQLNYYLSLSDTFKNDSVKLPTVDKAIKNDSNTLEKFAASGFNGAVILDTMTKSVLQMSINDKENPLIQLKRLGSTMLSSATAILTYLLTNSKDVGPTTGFIISFFGFSLVSILFTGGITMSFIVPMMPVIIWIGMLFGWIVTVLEAVIATPLWVIMHLTPTKDNSFIGGQRQGYTLVLSLIVKPALMVLGFISSVIVLIVMGYFINILFVFMYSMTQIGASGFITSLIGIVVVPLMYCGIVYVALKEILSLMHKVPDELLNWFGGGGPQLGQTAHSVNEGSTRAFGAIIGNPIGQPLGSLKHALAERGGALAQIDQNKMTADRNKSDNFEKMRNMFGGGDAANGSIGGGQGPDGDGGGDGGLGSDAFHTSLSQDGLNNDTQTSLQKALDSGAVKNDPTSQAKLKAGVFKYAPSDIANSAIKQASMDAMQEHQANVANGNNRPMDMDNFVKNVNDNIGKAVFGDEKLWDDLKGHQDLMNGIKSGNGDKLMNATMRKINNIANREGGDYQAIANGVGSSINNAFQGFQNDTAKHTYTPKDFTPYNYHNGSSHLRHKIASMQNGWKSYVMGSASKSSDYDTMKYQRPAYNDEGVIPSSANDFVKDPDNTFSFATQKGEEGLEGYGHTYNDASNDNNNNDFPPDDGGGMPPNDGGSVPPNNGDVTPMGSSDINYSPNNSSTDSGYGNNSTASVDGNYGNSSTVAAGNNYGNSSTVSTGSNYGNSSTVAAGSNYGNSSTVAAGSNYGNSQTVSTGSNYGNSSTVAAGSNYGNSQNAHRYGSASSGDATYYESDNSQQNNYQNYESSNQSPTNFDNIGYPQSSYEDDNSSNISTYTPPDYVYDNTYDMNNADFYSEQESNQNSTDDSLNYSVESHRRDIPIDESYFFPDEHNK